MLHALLPFVSSFRTEGEHSREGRRNLISLVFLCFLLITNSRNRREKNTHTRDDVPILRLASRTRLLHFFENSLLARFFYILRLHRSVFGCVRAEKIIRKYWKNSSISLRSTLPLAALSSRTLCPSSVCHVHSRVFLSFGADWRDPLRVMRNLFKSLESRRRLTHTKRDLTLRGSSRVEIVNSRRQGNGVGRGTC